MLNVLCLSVVLGAAAQPPAAPSNPGYYRQPALSKDAIVFVSEGDLWRVPLAGGAATRLTSHPADESQPAISPDGATIAFIAEYEGFGDVYTMPINGGPPKRLTWDGVPRTGVAGWTPDGKVLTITERFSTLPNQQLATIDPATGRREVIPLWQASDGAIDPGSKALAFIKLPAQGSATKRYKGGYIQQLWLWPGGDAEATPITADFEGTSKRPMWHDGRVYFLSDRDGHMNVWSSTREGKDLRQHTRHDGFDAAGASLANGRIAYQLGADIYLLDLSSNNTAQVPITIQSDFDQLRERWVEKPVDYLTSVHPSPDGDRVVITARGRIFALPHKQGRIVDIGRDDAVRYRSARFTPDGKSILAISDKTGELEVWQFPANGVGEAKQLTDQGDVLRWDAIASPDGTRIAHHDKNRRLYVLDVASGKSTQIDTQPYDDFSDLAWSPDSRWLAYVNQAENTLRIIKLWSAETGAVTAITTDRFESYSPAWHPGGKWLYFLSDRTLRTLQPSPWGPNAPQPFLAETTKIYAVSLQPGERWPFAPKDELAPAKKPDEKKEEPKKDDAKKDDAKKDEPKKDEPAKPASPPVKPITIALDGIAERIYEVPIPAANYDSLSVNEKALFFLVSPTSFDRKNDLRALEIKNDPIEVKTALADVSSFEPTADGKKLLIRRRDSLFIVDANPAPAAEPEKNAVALGGWTFPVEPRRQWRQMYTDAWRLMRDYFYDPAMHGVDWPAMRAKYQPLIDRVATRAELNDVLAQLVGELSALHIFVRGGDGRSAPAADRAPVASLGAVLTPDAPAGGLRITRIYQHDPDEPGRASPLARPEVGAKEGMVITAIDGVPALSVADPGVLLRHKAGKQVLLSINTTPGLPGPAVMKDAIAVPISADAEADLRYHAWQYATRRAVEEKSKGRIGYVHLRAMGGENYTEWAKGYFPAFNREGLIIDVRHNRGGNIDAWILSMLLRKPWFYWSPRVGNTYWNMHYAFRGHVVVICNERTASDGEAFAEGFRRLGLGQVIGMRTWGGEIWLSSSNVLLDKGIASAAEIGVFGPDGTWLIEGRGVEPDVVVENPPHATFKGEDAQLAAAIAHLEKLMREKPVPPVTTPAKPDKSFPGNKREKAPAGNP